MPSPNHFVRPGTLLIHAGPHKTGTTAIQKTLLENRRYLEDLGIFYPDVGLSYFGHHKLVDSLDRADHAALILAHERLQQLSPYTVVLSSENFSRSSPETVARSAQLAAGFKDVRVVFYVRSFLQLFYAWWQELVKHRQADEFCNYLACCLAQPFTTHLLNAAGMLHKFAEAFGAHRITVFLYEDVMRTNHDTAHHFMTEVLGVPGYVRQEGIRGINTSLDPISAEIVRAVNRGGAHGIQVFEQNPAIRELRTAMRRQAGRYMKTVNLNYQQFLPRALERSLIEALLYLNIPISLQSGNELDLRTGRLFEERDHDIQYLDPMIWLFEPEISLLMREIFVREAVAHASD